MSSYEGVVTGRSCLRPAAPAGRGAQSRALGHPGAVTLLMPFVLVGPLLMLATAVVALWQYGPAGWLASVLLVLAVLLATRWTWRAVRRWWAGTKAPVRTRVPGRTGQPG